MKRSSTIRMMGEPEARPWGACKRIVYSALLVGAVAVIGLVLVRTLDRMDISEDTKLLCSLITIIPLSWGVGSLVFTILAFGNPMDAIR